MITFYESETGRIKQIFDGDPPALEATKENSPEPWIEGGFDWNTHYILNGVAVERPTNPAVLDNLTLKNVPAPCKILINSVAYDVDEETVELDLPMSAKYKIVIEKFPFLDAEFEIET